jgi:hypothetical protein
MFVVPADTSVTRPLDELTVATLVLLDVYVNAEALVEVGGVTCSVPVVVTTELNENVPYVATNEVVFDFVS